jgi:hypothetical protein
MRGRTAKRPRKTCSAACYTARKVRRQRALLADHVAESARWWLSLGFSGRCAASAWARVNSPPAWFKGGRSLWAYCNRSAFSCEGRARNVAT